MVGSPRVFHVVVVPDAQAMYVLALVTQKGGSGKSTLTVGIAVAAMGHGERVGIVDADPQETISKWIERRGHPYPRVVRVADPAGIEEALVSLEAEGIWLTIIDTAPTNNALAMRAIASADLCLIPVRPSLADIEAAIPTLIAIRRLYRRFAFVLNQTPPRGCRLSEAATSLNSQSRKVTIFTLAASKRHDLGEISQVLEKWFPTCPPADLPGTRSRREASAQASFEGGRLTQGLRLPDQPLRGRRLRRGPSPGRPCGVDAIVAIVPTEINPSRLP
ncbi:AAA family ATPase [Bradyrhizobium elkanii]